MSDRATDVSPAALVREKADDSTGFPHDRDLDVTSDRGDQVRILRTEEGVRESVIGFLDLRPPLHQRRLDGVGGDDLDLHVGQPSKNKRSRTSAL
jgi:hypothetical protein